MPLFILYRTKKQSPIDIFKSMCCCFWVKACQKINGRIYCANAYNVALRQCPKINIYIYFLDLLWDSCLHCKLFSLTPLLMFLQVINQSLSPLEYVVTRENKGTERENHCVGREMSIPLKLFLVASSKGILFPQTSTSWFSDISQKARVVFRLFKSLLESGFTSYVSF